MTVLIGDGMVDRRECGRNIQFISVRHGTVLVALLKDKAALTKVLTYHVVPGKVLAQDVKPGDVATVEGSALTITSKNGKVMVDGATVVQTDVMADNGVIHVIDSVIMPK